MNDLEIVVLKRDVPEAHLRAGDMGTIVHTYSRGRYEVEFVTGGGETVAVLTLPRRDIRPLGHRELLHARALR